MTAVDTFKPYDKLVAEQLSHEELNELWVPDRQVWLDLDKNQQLERKEEWKYSQRSLKQFAITEIRGSYLKAHKNLYFKGLVDFDDFAGYPWQSTNSFGGAFPLFYMWYYPGLTKEKCGEIFEYFSRPCFVLRSAHDLMKSRDAIFFRYQQGNYSANGEYGFMGERMGIIAPHLLGEKGEDTSFEKVSESKQIAAGGIIGVMSASLGCLTMPNPYLYRPGRYIWRQASFHLRTFLAQYALIYEEIKTCRPAEQHVNENKLQSWNTRTKLLISAVEGFVHFDNHPEVQKDNPKVVSCRNEILDQYENGEFAEPMNALFDLIKANGLGNTTPEQVRALI